MRWLKVDQILETYNRIINDSDIRIFYTGKINTPNFLINLRGIIRRSDGCAYYPVIVCFFLFIVFLNILGLFSYVFTPTAHLVVTLGISYSIVMGITVSG